MSVRAVKRGLRVEEVYDGSPAKEGGLKEGDIIVAANGKPLEGKTSDESTTLIKGPAGTSVRLKLSNGRELTLKRAKVDIPIVQSELERSDGKKIAWVRLAGFTSGSGDDVKAAVEKEIKAGAKGVVLDLRHNGGGLLNEAVTVSSVFLDDGRVVSTKGRARPERVYNAEGGAISDKIPVVVLVDEGVGLGLGDRHRRAAGPQAGQGRRHAHVRQGRLPGDRAAAQRRRAGHHRRRVLPPSGRNLGGGGVRKGAGMTPDIQATDDPKTSRDEALQKALETAAAG